MSDSDADQAQTLLAPYTRQGDDLQARTVGVLDADLRVRLAAGKYRGKLSFASRDGATPGRVPWSRSTSSMLECEQFSGQCV